MTTPQYKVEADGADITRAIATRLILLRLTDEAGVDSDNLQLTLDDRGGELAQPRTGVELRVHLGYQGRGLTFMGAYTVDELEMSGPPQTLIIRARAADLRESLKAPKTRSWHATTIGSIVGTIAAEHGYTARVTPALASKPIAHIDQTAESDMNLLTRLAIDNDAMAKPANGFLLFTARASGQSVSGLPLPAVALAAGEVTTYRVTLPERGKYAAVVANFHSTALGEKVPVTAGSGEPVYHIKHSYPDPAQAASAAKTRLDSFARGLGVLSLTLPGRPTLLAESRLSLSCFRAGVSGDGAITRVVHTIDANGYQCQLDAEVPAP